MIAAFMERAIELASRGRGLVEPNPMVGAVVVRQGVPVGEGWHASYGGPHAEVVALRAAGEAARGADLYVSLEPCSTYGKTPPCTDSVTASGIERVFVAVQDPSERNGGFGIARLRERGVVVEVGALAERAEPLLEWFRRHLAANRPHVVAKWAMTLDGKIATPSGDSRWISSEASRRRVHEERSRADAVMVGIGTGLTDDPELSCRLAPGRQPVRIVADPDFALGADSKLVRGAREQPTWVIGRPDREAAARPLAASGVRIEVISGSPENFHLGALERLRALGIGRLLVEGGQGLLTSLLEVRAIDQVLVFVAPKLVGGATAKSPLAGMGREPMSTAIRLSHVVSERIDDDVLVRGFLEESPP
ncbi:MAG: bifunctional diaminohydroxyphosphoribosylaminopyrimidine deaminase/5-amino-6-(5-phosphoribosylamino)uracil reductase RibD [Planctomycetota bacterium]